MFILNVFWCWHIVLEHEGSGLGVGVDFCVLIEKILDCAGLFLNWTWGIWGCDFWFVGTQFGFAVCTNDFLGLVGCAWTLGLGMEVRGVVWCLVMCDWTDFGLESGVDLEHQNGKLGFLRILSVFWHGLFWNHGAKHGNELSCVVKCCLICH